MRVATSVKGECHSELSEKSPANQMDLRFFVVALLRMTSIRIISDGNSLGLCRIRIIHGIFDPAFGLIWRIGL